MHQIGSDQRHYFEQPPGARNGHAHAWWEAEDGIADFS